MKKGIILCCLLFFSWTTVAGGACFRINEPVLSCPMVKERILVAVQTVMAAWEPATPEAVVQAWAHSLQTENRLWTFVLLGKTLAEEIVPLAETKAWPKRLTFSVADFFIKELAPTVFQVDFWGRLAQEKAVYQLTVGLEKGKWRIVAEELKAESLTYRVLARQDLTAELRNFVEQDKEEPMVRVFPGEGRQFLFLSLGRRNTGGYSLEICAVEKRGEQVVVTYREKRPLPGEMVLQVLTYPWQMIEIETLWPLVVQEKKEEKYLWQ